MLLYIPMSQSIMLSDQTKGLISRIGTDLPLDLHPGADCIERGKLLAVLDHLDTKEKSNRFLLESLRASLLKDLSRSLLREKEKENESENHPQKSSFFTKLKFWALLIGGTILALCEGYDGIISFFPLVTIPVWVGQIVLVVFALLSALAFYAFELDQISENIGVKLPEVRRLLDVLVEQSNEINLIRKKIKKINTDDLDELRYLSAMLKTLIHTQNQLNELKKEFNDGFNNPYLNAAKIAATVVTGVIYFSGGFFASQIPVVSFFALLGITLTATAWPAVIASTLIGLAAFGVYWYVQRPAVDGLVSNLFGLDKDKINVLDNCKKSVISDEESTGLDRLLEVERMIAVKERNLTSRSKSPMLQEPSTAPLFVPLRLAKRKEPASVKQPSAHSVDKGGNSPIFDGSAELTFSPHDNPDRAQIPSTNSAPASQMGL